MSRTETGDIATAALAAWDRGWSVVPVRPRGKAPLIPWKRYQQERARRESVEHWFQHWPDANVSAITGELSGIVVLDIDPRHSGEDSLEQLEAEHGSLPATVEARTGGGGRHLYFRHPGYEQPNRVGFRPGLDIRGDGGSIVLPPSIHQTGKRYEWVKGRDPEHCGIATMPECLQETLRD